MSGKAGGIPAALAGPENVPDESDCPRPVRASQGIFAGHSDSGGEFPAPDHPRWRVSRPSIFWITGSATVDAQRLPYGRSGAAGGCALRISYSSSFACIASNARAAASRTCG